MSSRPGSDAKAPEDNLGMLMALTFRTMVDRHASALADLNDDWLRPSHAYVLHAVAEAPCSLKELSELNQVSKQAMSQIVDQLVDRDLVHRGVDPMDRRALAVTITDEGRRALLRAADAWAVVEEQVRFVVGDRNLETTLRTLRRYLEAEANGPKSHTKISRVW